MTHDIRIDNDSNYPVNNERIQLPYSLFMLNPTRTIKQLLGQNITIISFTYSDVITNDENIIVDVKYTSIPISILKIYYIETSSLKHIMPNNEKYVATINGCNVKISLPNLDKDMKILPIRIKPTLSNNYSSSGQLNAQFAYYGIPVSINNCMNYLCTPLKYINHKYEPFQSEPVKPIYNESFKAEMLKHMQLDETIKELDEFSLTNYKQSIRTFNVLSSVDHVLIVNSFDECKLGTTGYIIDFNKIPLDKNINGIILIQPKRNPYYVLFYPTKNFTICIDELKSIKDFLDQDIINYFNLIYLHNYINIPSGNNSTEA